ncbi:MAG: hypothetical protein RID09_14320 [Coleofasciculus sp. G1-WW12-02]
MNIKELEPQLLALKPTEKAQLIHLLTQSFNNNWKEIEKTSGVCDGNPNSSSYFLFPWKNPYGEK